MIVSVLSTRCFSLAIAHHAEPCGEKGHVAGSARSNSAPGGRGHLRDVPCHLLVARNSLKSVAQHFDPRSAGAMFQQVSLTRLRNWTDLNKPRNPDADHSRRRAHMRCSHNVIAAAPQQGKSVAVDLARVSSCNVPTSVIVTSSQVVFETTRTSP